MNNKPQKRWTEYLPNDVYTRLCNCTTIRQDLPFLVSAKWRAYQESGKATAGFTKEDALVAVLELLDCNSIDFELTMDEYNELCFVRNKN